jgi:hypothetical protein
MPTRDDDHQSLDPREFPDPDADDEAGLLPCANCLAVIHEDTQRCPRCGHYLTRSDLNRKGLWFVAVVLLCLALIVLGVWMGW